LVDQTPIRDIRVIRGHRSMCLIAVPLPRQIRPLPLPPFVGDFHGVARVETFQQKRLNPRLAKLFPFGQPFHRHLLFVAGHASLLEATDENA
jgi:hypothetical protein